MATKLNKAQLEFVEKITKSLDEGVVPWRATWDRPIQTPYNASTNVVYKGQNLLNLWITQNQMHFDDPRWLTFKQANALGYKIKQGSKGTAISYWSLRNKVTNELVTQEEYEQMSIEEREDILPVSKSYIVFNAAQISGIPELKKEERKEIIFENEKAKDFSQRLTKNMELEILHKGSSAYYSPSEDQVVLPPMNSFMDEQAYYATYLHEVAHATSHESRLDRKIGSRFGTAEYAEEELRAEITASFLSMDVGFHVTEFHEQNHQSYIQYWSKKIKNNPGVIFDAVKEAQKIREYMLEKGEYELIYQQEQEMNKENVLRNEIPADRNELDKENMTNNILEEQKNADQRAEVGRYAIYKESMTKSFADEIKDGNFDGFRLAQYQTEEGQDISYHGSPMYSTIHQFTDLESGKQYRYDAYNSISRNIIFHEIEDSKIDLSNLKQSVKNNIDELQKEIARLNEQILNIEKAEHVFNDFIRESDLFQKIPDNAEIQTASRVAEKLPAQETMQTEEPLERNQESSTSSVQKSPQMKKTQKEILEDMKNSVSIAEYARDVLGYNLVRMARNRIGLEEFESCVIYPNNTFYRYSVGVGGSIIDFIKMCENCDTHEAIDKLKKYYHEHSPEKRFDTHEDLKQYDHKKTMIEGINVPERNSTNKHVYAYLTKTRCIKPSIVNDYLKRHLLYEDTHKNCVFLGKLDKTILYGFSRGTGETAFKQDLSGSVKEVGIYVNNNSNVLVVNEAVIDQMSYMSLLDNPKKFNYLAVNGAGNAVNAVRFHMKKRPEAKQISSVIIGLDNDQAGITNTEKLIEYLKEENPDIEVLVHQPTAKDFNEQLQNEMRALANAAPSVDEALAAI